MRATVYVEGQSEMLFVADILQKYSNYDPTECGFHCINLVADNLNKIPYPGQGDPNSRNFYQIINANSDVSVNSRLQKDTPRLIAAGYEIIIGLRDVYGDQYKQINPNARTVDRDKIQLMHDIQTSAIGHSDKPCHLQYAVMEFEAWMLAMIENYIITKGGNPSEILAKYNIPQDCDIEQIYHPYPLVQKVFKECGEDGNPHESDTYTFLSTLTVDDYENLRHSGRCPSFTAFIDRLLPVADA